MTNDKDFFDRIMKFAKKGYTLQKTADKLKCHSRTVQRSCKAHYTKYSAIRVKKKLILKSDKADKGKNGKSGSSGGNNSPPQDTQKEDPEKNNIFLDMSNKKIDEDFYQEYLKEVIQITEPNIKILTELRNYLDKKQELKPAAQGALEMTPEQIVALSVKMEEIH